MVIVIQTESLVGSEPSTIFSFDLNKKGVLSVHLVLEIFQTCNVNLSEVLKLGLLWMAIDACCLSQRDSLMLRKCRRRRLVEHNRNVLKSELVVFTGAELCPLQVMVNMVNR